MSASVLDGKALATQRRQKLRESILQKTSKGNPSPQLAVILLGNDPASTIYVSNKRKACDDVGIQSKDYNLPETTSEKELLELIDHLNESPLINGILVQLPLPKHIKTTTILERIFPEKDVDGFHPYNIGRLAQRIPLLRPCTPLGIMHLLKHYNISIKRKHAVIIGASNIVGRPMCLELLLAGATVTICHKFTTGLRKHVESADLLIIAAGKQDVVDVQWLSEKQVIVDVGIHRLPDGTIRGDIHYEKAAEKVAWITPVPGGVGPMTIVSLLENTYSAYLRTVK
ncbi:bifunctional methylenetetrahydrofolate dehydrogenase/methenyltetrahydrofolate cyclohydrolase FolD [Legionella israelensis]|uniref:Bifunctional protein FolD n=1 Tax=Legionella israelensis TaxID=454 RepID=A0AAX1EH38_9GAMM|nr:bifunctional methylenetetrahydrofolate dehydrogenase/methenyltetrahydrofolate cyclohydrolase FolD [Legionella israelensis]QBR84383.1 bifunctional methylenetetrahydrofolate dehydrogenase/methenyltetrahydrofolate cyclohydrolase FolD [Legionella israelensis]